MKTLILSLALFLAGCPGWQIKHSNPKEEAGNVLLMVSNVTNIADKSLKAAIKIKSDQVTSSTEFAKSLDGYDCLLNEKGDLIGAPRQLQGLTAATCYYDYTMLPYKTSVVAINGFREQLRLASKAVDQSKTGNVQAIVTRCIDGGLTLVSTINKLGVKFPEELKQSLGLVCAGLKGLYPTATCNSEVF